MEKITKALIDEINDITTYSDLIKSKIIDVVITHDVRNSEKKEAAVLNQENKSIELKLRQKQKPTDL